jgi:cyclophilin family peptidyl-prolyl cis-trans isomerase
MRKIKMKIKRLIAVILCLSMVLGLSGCRSKGDFAGNVGELRDLQPGDLYAEIRFRDFDGVLTFVLFKDIAPNAVTEFIRLVEIGYYDGKTIHRVLKDLMIQGGALIPDGTDPTVPDNEVFAIETHKNARNFNGALAFAPRESDGKNYRQFYVISSPRSYDIDARIKQLEEDLEKDKLAEDEDKLTDVERKELEELIKTYQKIPDAVKERYLEQGGFPLLDDKVTVFGQLISGQELLREISSVPVVRGNRVDDMNTAFNDGDGHPSRPAEDIFISEIKIIRVAPEENNSD